MPDPQPRAPRSRLAPASDLAAGLMGALRGIGFVRRHPRLWTWIVAPFLINLAAFLGLATLGWRVAHGLLPDLAAGDWGWADWLRVGLAPVLAVLMGLVAALAAALATLLVSGVVNAPFHDLLSEKVEALARGRPAPPRTWGQSWRDMRAALAAATALAVQQAAVMAVLFGFSFTAVGAPLFIAAGFFFTGFSLADVTLARQRLDAPARRAFARRRALLLLGLGLPVSLVPPLQPFGIVGATLLLLDAPSTLETAR